MVRAVNPIPNSRNTILRSFCQNEKSPEMTHVIKIMGTYRKRNVLSMFCDDWNPRVYLKLSAFMCATMLPPINSSWHKVNHSLRVMYDRLGVSSLRANMKLINPTPASIGNRSLDDNSVTPTKKPAYDRSAHNTVGKTTFTTPYAVPRLSLILSTICCDFPHTPDGP